VRGLTVGGCYVQVATSPKTTVDCPAALTDPAWAKSCHDQLVVVRGDVCQCEIFADPPYVGQVPCPKP